MTRKAGPDGAFSVTNPFGYPDAVWRLFNAAPRAGTLPAAEAIVGEATGRAGRARLRLHAVMAGSRISDARFQAYGCPTTIAVGAWLAEQAVGRTLAEFGGTGAVRIREALEIPEERIHCTLLGEDVVKSLLAAAGQAREASSVSVQVTERAARRIQEQIRQRGKGLGLRLGVKKSGCSGYAYVLDYADAVGPADLVFESHGARVVVARDEMPMLSGLSVDWRREGLGEAFRFDNPNAKALCGCGESFTVEPERS
jgi:iron-sulfur cluster assembly protein